MYESEKWKWSCSVVSDSQQPHGVQPIRLLRPWDFPGKSTGVGCHCLLRRRCYGSLISSKHMTAMGFQVVGQARRPERRAQAMGSHFAQECSIKKRGRVVNFLWSLTTLSFIHWKKELVSIHCLLGMHGSKGRTDVLESNSQDSHVDKVHWWRRPTVVCSNAVWTNSRAVLGMNSPALFKVAHCLSSGSP